MWLTFIFWKGDYIADFFCKIFEKLQNFEIKLCINQLTGIPLPSRKVQNFWLPKVTYKIAQFGSIRLNLAELAEFDSIWLNLAQFGSILLELAQIDLNWLELAQIGSNWLKLTWIILNWLELAQIGSKWLSLA